MIGIGTGDLKKILKVAIYSGASAFVGVLITKLTDIQVPVEYAILVPVVNAILVALKKLFDSEIE